MQFFNEAPIKPDVSDTSELPEENVDRPDETEGWKNSIELPDDTGGWVNSIELPNDSEEWQENINLVSEPNRPLFSSAVASDGNTSHSDKPNESQTLTEEEKNKIKEETGWSDEIVDNIQNIKQYEILKNAGLIEVEINGRKCLIKENIDLDYADEDGVSNRDKIARGLAPLDSKTGKPIELHHLGQKADSPLVELTEEEHRTGEYEDGKKNQSLWHDNAKETEVHGEGSSWDQERKAHWKTRAENNRG